MFLHVSVCPHGGARMCGRGAVHGRGHAWQGGMQWQGVCVIGAMHGKGIHMWKGACVEGGHT